MKKSKVLIDLSIFLFLFTGFFGYAVINGYYWLIASVIPISLYVINAVVMMDKENYGWVVFIAFAWISAMVSVYTTASYKYLLLIGIVFLAKLIFESVYGWHLKFSKLVRFYATVHVLAIILSYFFPDFITGIVEAMYTEETFENYYALFEFNAFAGLTPQTGNAAFYASIFIAFCVTDILSEKLTIWNVFKLALGIFALLLTVKRSFVVAHVIAIMFVLYIQGRGNKKVLRSLMGFTITLVLAYYLFSNVSFVEKIVSKSAQLLESGDITNGRMYLWSETYKRWLEKPIFGHGVNVLDKFYNLSTHNSYLQILAEAGVFGAISLVVALVMSLTKSCRIYADVYKDTLLTTKEKSIFLSCVYMQVVFIVYCFSGNPMHGMNFLLMYMLFISCIKSFLRRKA